MNATALARVCDEARSKLTDHVVFRDGGLASKYAERPIPVAALYEAYFADALEIPGDASALLRCGQEVLSYTVTRPQLAWAFETFGPLSASNLHAAAANPWRALYDGQAEDFFVAFLGEALAYTSGHFRTAADSLERAAQQSAARVCEKLGLQAGHRLLELGCGWGAFLEHAVRERGASVTGITRSAAQAATARRRLARSRSAGRILAADANGIPAQRFDRIVCLELAENAGRTKLEPFCARLFHALEDDGLVVWRWLGLRPNPNDLERLWGLFTGQFALPGADVAVPLSCLLQVAEEVGWEVQNTENLSPHFLRTLQRWRHNWEAARARVSARYGERWFRVWRFFLAWCEVVIERGGAACHEVVLSKNPARARRLVVG